MKMRLYSLLATAAVACTGMISGTAASAAPAPSDDPALQQTVAADEEIGHGPTEITQGHVDMGPKMVDGQFSVLVRDDSVSPPVWRDPNEVVLRVSDAAKTTLPEGDRYSFLGATAGTEMYVVPQTQNQDVVWLGWNTQDPEITQLLDRGVTMTYRGHTGPGTFHLFLESGTFDVPPEVLWDSTAAASQEFWVDVNTHTHANWVFSEPGIHLVDVTVKGKTVNGDEVSADTVLRFAVGTAVTTEEALAATSNATTSAAATTAESAAPAAPSATAAQTENRAPYTAIMWVVVAVVAIVVIGLIVGLMSRRSARLRAQAHAEAEEKE